MTKPAAHAPKSGQASVNSDASLTGVGSPTRGSNRARVQGVLRKIGEVVLSLWILSIASFLIGAFGTGDASSWIVRTDSAQATQEDIQAARNALGLDDPLWQRYWDFQVGLFQGDFGRSAVTGNPVAEQVWAALPATLNLAFAALGLAIVMMLIFGWLAARFAGSWIDKLILGICYLGASVPSFWLGLVFITWFSVRLGWFPSSGWHGGAGLVLPALVLAIAIMPPFVKVFRERFIAVHGQDFIRAARARGISQGRIEWVHILRGCLIPVVTMMGVSFASLLSGTVVIEVVFGLPGMGSLAVDAIAKRDWAYVQGFVFLMGVGVIITTVIVDLVVRWIDPATRADGRNT
ncbi:MAG: ABC transporter permease [Corynebacterium sp.]|nr:ABC transporter permease [Corynebacterium sp.]